MHTLPIYYLDICPQCHYDIRLVTNRHIHSLWQRRADLEPLGDVFGIKDNACIHICISSTCDFNAIMLWSVWLLMPLYTNMSIHTQMIPIHDPHSFTSITFPSGYNLGSRSSSTPIARKKDVNLWPAWVGGFYKKILSMITNHESNYTHDIHPRACHQSWASMKVHFHCSYQKCHLHSCLVAGWKTCWKQKRVTWFWSRKWPAPCLDNEAYNAFTMYLGGLS